MHEARSSYAFASVFGPPVRAGCRLLVELAALIVEPVRQFVADDRAGAAVVDRGLASGLVERRLQNARRGS